MNESTNESISIDNLALTQGVAKGKGVKDRFMYTGVKIMKCGSRTGNNADSILLSCINMLLYSTYIIACFT